MVSCTSYFSPVPAPPPREYLIRGVPQPVSGCECLAVATTVIDNPISCSLVIPWGEASVLSGLQRGVAEQP